MPPMRAPGLPAHLGAFSRTLDAALPQRVDPYHHACASVALIRVAHHFMPMSGGFNWVSDSETWVASADMFGTCARVHNTQP